MKAKNPERTLPDDLDQFSFQAMDSSPSFQMSRSKQNNREFSLKDQFPVDHPKLFGAHDESLNSKKSRSQKNISTSVIVHIKLGKDLTKEIKCDLDDDVLGLAQTFCKENNLAPDAVPVIINMIKKQFAVILQRMKSQNKSKDAEGSFETNHSVKSPHFKESHRTNQRFDGPVSARETESEITDTSIQEKSKLIGKLDVAISPTQTMELKLYEGQDPVETAYKFCKENKLQKNFVEVLARKLDELRKAHSYRKLKQQREKRAEEIGGGFQKEIRQTFGKKGKGNNQSREVSEDSRVEEKGMTMKNVEYKNPFQLKPGQMKEVLGSPNFAENVGKDGENEENDRSQLDISLEEDEKGNGKRIKEEEEEVVVSEEILPKEENQERGRQQKDLAGAYERWAGLIKNKQMVNMVSPHAQGKGTQPPSSILAGLTAQQDRSKSQTVQKEKEKEKGKREVSPLSALPGARMLKTKEGAFIQTIENGSPRANRKKRPIENDKLHKLYYDGLTNKANNAEKNKVALTKKQQEEEKELTFQPNLNRSPPKYERAERSPGGTMTTKHHKLTELQYLQQKQDTFTFKPYISPRSLELAANRSKSQTPVSKKLNMDDPSNKKENVELKMPEKVENPLKNKKKQKELANRLILEGKYKEDRLVRQRAAENNGLDPKTGQKLYHPVIPHDQYYHKLKQMDEEKSSRSKMTSKSPTPRHGESHVSSTFKTASQFSNSKSLLREVFDKLDSDHDGFISAKEIDLSQIDTNVLEALLDLMDFLENNQSRINFDGFLLALDGLGIEEEVLKAIEKEQFLDLSPKTNASAKIQLFRQEESPGSSGRIVETEPDLWGDRKMLNVRSKRSDFSTASSNMTEKSHNKITKHYKELLEKQGGRKIY